MQDNNYLWVTYLFPMRLITPDAKKVSFSLDEINSCTYDHSLLCRIIGTVENTLRGIPVKYIVCGDGAIAIESKCSLSLNDLLLHFNDLICKLLLGGLDVESISSKDITTGYLHGQKSLWPVNFGNSHNTHLHACIRMKLSNSFDAIMLDGAASNSITFDEFKEKLLLGCNIVERIPNLSTYHLITGISEMKYNNWSAAVTNLWIVAEQITDFLWSRDFIEVPERDPDIPTRKQSLKQDHRTYSASVKQEILYQIGIIPKSTYADIYSIRKARNKWPGVKFCVSDFRQSQEWRWKAGRILA